jgi:hypothetical protein
MGKTGLGWTWRISALDRASAVAPSFEDRSVPQRVYFDTNGYDELVKPVHDGKRAALVSLVRSGHCHVYGSGRVIDELGAIQDSARFATLMRFFWEIVRTDLLLDRGMLVEKELEKGERLSFREACFDRREIPGLRRASFDRELLKSVTAEVKAGKRARSKEVNRALGTLAQRTGHRVREWEARDPGSVQADYNAYLTKVSQAEIQGFLDQIRGEFRLATVSLRQAPCLSACIAYALARAKRSLRDGKTFEQSAVLDWDHFIYSAEPGTLVTADEDLVKTIRVIELPLVTVRSPAEFLMSL